MTLPAIIRKPLELSEELHEALAAHEGQIPCQDRTLNHLWISEQEDEQTAASQRCGDCPILQTCKAYGLKNKTEIGVYGGLTKNQRNIERRKPGRPKKVSPK